MQRRRRAGATRWNSILLLDYPVRGVNEVTEHACVQMVGACLDAQAVPARASISTITSQPPHTSPSHPSYPVPSHPLTPTHPTLSHPIPSHPIPPYAILSDTPQSHLTRSDTFGSTPVRPHLIRPYPRDYGRARATGEDPPSGRSLVGGCECAAWHSTRAR